MPGYTSLPFGNKRHSCMNGHCWHFYRFFIVLITKGNFWIERKEMIDWILLWILKLFPIVQMPNSASWQKCYLSKSLTWKVSYLSFSSILLTSLILRKPNISSFLFFNDHLFWWSIKPQFLLSIVRCSQCSLCNLWLKFGFRLMFYHCTVNSQKYHILNFLV